MKRKSKSEPESESESESESTSPESSSEEEEEESEEEEEEVEEEEGDDASESEESESESEESESSESEEDEGSKKRRGKKRGRGGRDGEQGEEEEVIDPTDRDAVRRLVEPFSKEQLMTLLTEAAMRNPAVMSAISSSAQSDPEHRKIFVHGLNVDATTEDLRLAFAPFGAIEEVKAVCDRNTGRCKGYGFVLFEHRSSAQNALKEPQRRIGDRTVQCQLASRGPAPKPKAGTTTSIVRASVDMGPNFQLLAGVNPVAGLGLLSQTGASPSLATGATPDADATRPPQNGTAPGNLQF